VPKCVNQHLVSRGRRRKVGVRRDRQFGFQPFEIAREFPIEQAARENDVRAAFCSADSVRDLAEGAVQPHAAELCFIYRVYEEPGVLIGRAPRGETRAFRCAQGAIKAVFGYILDGSEERVLGRRDAEPRLLAHLFGFPASCFGQQDHPATCRNVVPAQKVCRSIKTRENVRIDWVSLAPFPKPAI
jgi:hypothetical protein